MSGPSTYTLDRARKELAAATLLSRSGFGPQAVSRAYYAAFYAAETALLEIGEARSKHSGVVAAVAHLLIRQHDLDQRAGQLLRSLFERRSQADYDLDDVPATEAERAIQDATLVVELLDEWRRRR